MEQFECFHDRNFSVYEQGMDATLDIKWRQIRPWIVPDDGFVVDEGCGTGRFLARLARAFPHTGVIGRDVSSHFILKAREATEGLTNASVLNADIAASRFPRRSVTTKIYSSVWHEIFSYQGYHADVLRKVLRSSFDELVPGGRIIIRDGVKPERQTVAMWLSPKRNQDKPSAREMFMRFVRDFDAVRRVSYGHLQTSDYELFTVLNSEDAYEFLMKKDYLESWAGEIKEIFGVWSKDDFMRELETAGFRVVHAHLYRNPWIIRHRLKPAVTLYRFSDNGTLLPIPFPATNITVVGEKPK